MKNLVRPDIRTTLEHFAIEIHQKGVHSFIRCPDIHHEDRNPSCQINLNGAKQTFKCYSCGVKGDVFDLIHLLTRKPLKQVLQDHNNNLSYLSFSTVQKKVKAQEIKPKEKDRSKFFEPLSKNEKSFEDLALSYVEFTQKKQRQEARSTFVAAYPNYNLHSELVQGFLRMKNPKGEKFFSQVLLVKTKEGEKYLKNQSPQKPNELVERLKRKVFEEKFQLYGVHHYFQTPAKDKVLIVEGQKCVESLITQFGNQVDTQFLGIWSTTSLKHFEWSTLKGKTIQLLPDHDKTQPSGRNAGMDAMRKIESILGELGIEVQVLQPLGKEPNGYDVSDFLIDNPSLSWHEFTRILKPAVTLKSIRRESKTSFLLPKTESEVIEGEVLLLDPERDMIPRWEWVNQHEDEEDSKRIKVKDTLPNFRHMLKRYGVEIYKDVIRKEIAIRRGEKDWTMGELKSIMSLNNMSQKNLQDYIESIAENTEKNVVLDWIQSKEWDGIPRFEKLFKAIHFRNDFDSEHHNREFVKTWMLRALHVLTPENMELGIREILVFQSKERVGKTSFFRNLTRGLNTYKNVYVGDGLSVQIGNKDSEMNVLRNWIAELGEIASTLKRDVDSLKQFFTRQNDSMRLPYGRKILNFPRKTIFAGTVNDEEFLREGENTRYWVLPLEGFDFNSLNELYEEEGGMQQVWAELWQEYQTIGYKALDKKAEELTDLFKMTNRQFRPKSWLEDSLPLYVESEENPTNLLTTDEIIVTIADRIGMKTQSNRSLQIEAGKILKSLHIKKKTIRGVRLWCCNIRLNKDTS